MFYFNIHVCSSGKLLIKDFLDLLDALGLTQSVNGPTHECTQTLDLVLFYGLSICNLEICDAVFSDHISFIHPAKLCAPAQCCCVFNPSTAPHFSPFFFLLDSQPSVSSSTEEFSPYLNSLCHTFLNSVAPIKTRRSKPRSDPWLSDHSRAIKRECRRNE